MASTSISTESEGDEILMIASGLCETSLTESVSLPDEDAISDKEETIFPFDNLTVELVEGDEVPNSNNNANENSSLLKEINVIEEQEKEIFDKKEEINIQGHKIEASHTQEIETSYLQESEANNIEVKTNNIQEIETNKIQEIENNNLQEIETNKIQEIENNNLQEIENKDIIGSNDEHVSENIVSSTFDEVKTFPIEFNKKFNDTITPIEAKAIEETYIESNILRQALSAPRKKEKPKPLSSFPRIVQALKKADYSTLQKLYELLYERSAWDTQEILMQRILNFSGFDCEINSEDYFNREIMLKTFPDEILLRIYSILSPETINSLQLDVEEKRNEMVTTIMSFLYKPVRKKSHKQKSTSEESIQIPKIGTSKKKSKKNTRKPPGPKSSKVKKSKTKKEQITDKKPPVLDKMQQILDLEKDLKEKISMGQAIPELKVCLTKLDLGSFCHLFGFSNLKDEKESSSEVDSKSEVEKVNVHSKTRLRDIQIVHKSMEHTSEELLLDIHSLLFLKDAEMHELRDNILNFDGFTFDSDTEEYDERKDFLERMPNKIVSDVAKAFSLKVSNNKDETIKIILSFLKKLDKKFLYLYSDLSNVELDIEKMSDSDDSITCEIVEKKVECIDLISSGEDSDSDQPIITKKEAKISIDSDQPIITKETAKISIVSNQPVITNEMATAPNLRPILPKKFTKKLRWFDTIRRIVNTHPHEYLIDLYELIFMKKPELRTLRAEILEFDGFKFYKGSLAYTKRKQMLDRMSYNSVRRIYNTLIHDTPEKVSGKATMIEEIFKFLFNLSDSDKPIPPPVVDISTIPHIDRPKRPIVQDAPRIQYPAPLEPTPSSKLSDLKRVFQRVACFPCEYLIDVHKLLFMTDCDPSVIRHNIFGFKGFSFSKDSPEFELRKKFLDYLTFHSLRKISSVLTTKSVDLRNSTKHELANHLTQVLAEYTNTYVETEPIGASNKDAIPIDPLQNTSNSEVENIVVTPYIETMPVIVNSLSNEADSSTVITPEIINNNPVNNQVPTNESHTSKRKHSFSPVSKSPDVIEVDVQQNNITSTDKKYYKSKIQSKESKSFSSQSIKQLISKNKGQKLIAPKVSLETQESSLAHKDDVSNKKRKLVALPIQVASVQNDPASSMQFQDINLPEIAKYQQLYGPQLKIDTPQSAVFQQTLPPTPGVNISLVPTNLISTPIFTYAQPNIVLSPIMQPTIRNFSPITQVTQPTIGTNISPVTQVTQPPMGTNISPIIQVKQPPMGTNISPITQVTQPTMGTNISPIIQVTQPPMGTNISPITQVTQPPMGTNISPITQPIISKIESLSNLPNDVPLEPIPVQSVQEPLPIKLIQTNFTTDETLNHQRINEEPQPSIQSKIRNVINENDEDDCNIPLAALLGHPNDKVLKQQICDIVEQTNLQDISINGVIQKIYDLYPEYDLGYRKEFIKSTLRSLLYKLGEARASEGKSLSSQKSDTQDCGISTSDIQETSET